MKPDARRRRATHALRNFVTSVRAARSCERAGRPLVALLHWENAFAWFVVRLRLEVTS